MPRQQHNIEKCPCAYCSAYRSHRSKVVAVLKHGDATVKDIVDRTEIHRSIAYRTLGSLVKVAAVERKENGVFHLISEARAAEARLSEGKSVLTQDSHAPEVMSKLDVIDALAVVEEKVIRRIEASSLSDDKGFYWRHIKLPENAVWRSGEDFFVSRHVDGKDIVSKVKFLTSEIEEAVQALYRMEEQSFTTKIPKELIREPPWVRRAIKAHNIEQLGTSADKPDPMDKSPSYGQFS